jgi:hypothetical protein
MKPPFSLIGDSLSHETVACLEFLLKEAKNGEVIGIAFAAMLRKRRFLTDTAGECYRNPVFARGMVAALDDELSHQSMKGRA